MIGNIKWNLIFASVFSLFAFIFSWLNNPLSTASLRTIYCFALLFVLMYPIRFIMGSLIGIKLTESETDSEEADVVGTQVDLATPEDESLLDELLTGQEQTGEKATDGGASEEAAAKEFKPMNPPKLVTKQSMDAEELAQAVRHLADEEGR